MRFFPSTRINESTGSVRQTNPVGSFFTLFAVAALSASAFSQEIVVESGLVSNKIAVGERGTFIINVDNGKPSNIPDQIEAAGLTVMLTGNQFSGNFSGQGRYSYFYAVVGEAEGEFTIPAIEIDVRGQKFNTQPGMVTVFKRKPGDIPFDPAKPFFAQLNTGVSEIYVNQIVPIEIKAFVKGRASIHEVGAPKLAHDAIVVRRFQNVEMDAREIGGALFSSATLPGAIYALKEGEHTIGPAEVTVRMIESDFGFSVFTQTRTRVLPTNSLTLKVKPLPPGAPATFSDAVGEFDLSVQSSLQTAMVGDPITLEFEVKGVGNFETLEAPVFLPNDASAWRTYDARKIVDPAENSDGINPGRATFSQILIPQKEVDAIPPFELSFLNPNTGEYEVRRTNAIPIAVKADPRAAQAPAPVISAANNGGGAMPTAAKPGPVFEDLLHIKTTPPNWREFPVSLASRPEFWIWQAVPALILCTLLAIGLIRITRRKTEKPERQPGDPIPFKEALAAIPGANSPRPEFYRAVKQALRSWRETTPKSTRQNLSTDVSRAYKALESRCEWLLYGADEAKRDGAVSDREASETRQILQALPTGSGKKSKPKAGKPAPAAKAKKNDDDFDLL
ncbi:MAG: hypothetical protein HKN23_09245 [Verrucomicrobiales bacterium]|nr:hypothetical protein [Verrucomicrobiales bacterium]